MGLMAEGMVQITEFHLKCMAEILLCAYTKLSPIFIGYRSPPGQSLARQQSDSHFDNICGLFHSGHLAELLDVECPVRQLLGITIKFFGLSNLIF